MAFSFVDPMIYQHVMDGPSIRPKSGEWVRGCHVVLGGSTYGRFLFQHSPAIEIGPGVENVWISELLCLWGG